MGVDISMKTRDGNTVTVESGMSHFYFIDMGVLRSEISAISGIIATLESQQDNLNKLLTAGGKGSISSEYLNYAFTDEFEDCVLSRARRLADAIKNLKLLRDNLQSLYNLRQSKGSPTYVPGKGFC